MARTLLIVESLAKAKTLRDCLGDSYTVLASYGHVQELCHLGDIKPDNALNIHYQVIPKSLKRLKAIRIALEKADQLFLATAPDPEGEALASHIHTLLSQEVAPLNSTKDKIIKRLSCDENTLTAWIEALKSPRDIDQHQVDSFHAEQVINQLINSNLTTLVSNKVLRDLTLNRHQCLALHLIATREIEITALTPKSAWQIQATLDIQNHQFIADVTHYNNSPLLQAALDDEAFAIQIKSDLINDAQISLSISHIETSALQLSPPLAFNTSSLCQVAAEDIAFSLQRTLRTARQLYEGINLDEGKTGLISYFLTQSLTLDCHEKEKIHNEVRSQFGEEQLLDEEHHKGTASSSTSAIRPTQIQRNPRSIKKYLSADQFKLYTLIWQRTLASQMRHAIRSTTDVTFNTQRCQLKSTISTISQQGFMAAYHNINPHHKTVDALPSFSKGEEVTLRATQLTQHPHQTSPSPSPSPKRYTEASLIKALDDYGVGRPSNYAPAITTLSSAGYAEIRHKHFYITETGLITQQFIAQYLPQLTDFRYMAMLENTLDAIGKDSSSWQKKTITLWQPLADAINQTAQKVTRKEVTHESIDEQCPTCNEPLIIRLGRLGRFVGCASYPACHYTRKLSDDPSSASTPDIANERSCPACQSSLTTRQGKFGEFVGCSNFPDCRYIEPKESLEVTQVACPECQGGQLVKRQSRSGSTFYSCQCYPSCTYAVWHPPIAENCPVCHWPIMTIKANKKRGGKKICPQKNCNFSMTCALPK